MNRIDSIRNQIRELKKEGKLLIQKQTAISKKIKAKQASIILKRNKQTQEKKTQRLLEVKIMRDDGATFREIGNRFGVGTMRGRDLYKQALRMRNFKKPTQDTPINEVKMSVRLANTICNATGGFQKPTLKEFAEEHTRSQLRRFRNFGDLSIAELESVLKSVGLSLKD